MPFCSDISVFRSGGRGVVKRSKAHLGVQNVGFDGERGRLSKELTGKFGEEYMKCTKILSAAAKAIIARAIAADQYQKMDNRYEPPFMAPSLEPALYSDWCSICNDFGETLVLCAGCRVGICTETLESKMGCLRWKAEAWRDDFVYYCPYCRNRKDRTGGNPSTELFLHKDAPPLENVYLRYDPPVLLIAATWHQLRNPFVNILHDTLAIKYHDGAPLVLRMDVSLAGILDEATVRREVKELEKLENPIKEVKNFLRDHEYAKIVVIVETHATDGKFVWRGEDPLTYEACTLFDILKDCIPHDVFKFLSNDPGAPDHKHRSLILNLACGSTVIEDTARHLLLQGHSADAVVSFGDKFNVSGEIALTLARFTSRWIQSASRDFDVIVAATISKEWALAHKPIISTRDGGHTLYTAYKHSQPGGQLLSCPSRCTADVDYRGKGGVGLVTCRGCRSICRVKIDPTISKTLLGKRGLIKTSYPQAVNKGATWELAKVKGPQRPLGPPMSRSISLPLLPTSLPPSSVTLPPPSTAPPPQSTAPPPQSTAPPPQSTTPPPPSTLLPSLTPPLPSSSTLPSSSSLRRIKILPPRPPQISQTRSDPCYIDDSRPTPRPLAPADAKRVISPDPKGSTKKRQRR